MYFKELILVNIGQYIRIYLHGIYLDKYGLNRISQKLMLYD